MSARAIEALKARLLEALAVHMASLGFDPKPAEQLFRKETPGGAWILHISFVEHETDVDVTADVAIRVDVVEDLVNKGNKSLTASERRKTATVGAELGNIADGRQRRWTLAIPAEAWGVAAAVLDEFQKFGQPYLERLSNPEVMLDALVRNDPAGWLHSPIHASRCMRAVALALVLGDRGQANAIAQACEAFLHERCDSGLGVFKQFVSRALPEF